MEIPEVLALVAAGVVAGIANTVAGGGSLLAVPILTIWLGYPATVANATIRPAIAFQNVFALLGFKRAGTLDTPDLLPTGFLFAACALPGALAGAFLAATSISDDAFKALLAAVMVGILLLTWVRRSGGNRKPDQDRTVNTPVAAALFVGIGFYGGFIQAGVGFLIMAALLNTTKFDLARINAQKVLVVLCYTLVAIVTFAWQGRIEWLPAGVLILGQSVGGYLGSAISVKANDKLLMRLYAALLLIFAVMLLVVKE